MNERAVSAKKDRNMFIILLAAALVLTAGFVLWPQFTASQQLSPRARFAECLSTKGVTMYGTDTCPNCQNQKGMFEDDFRRIHYVNCDIQQEECTQKGIQGYPTWMYNGLSVMGVQPFQSLSALSGCQAP